jgi:hypothetical protein
MGDVFQEEWLAILGHCAQLGSDPEPGICYTNFAEYDGAAKAY